MEGQPPLLPARALPRRSHGLRPCQPLRVARPLLGDGGPVRERAGEGRAGARSGNGLPEDASMQGLLPANAKLRRAADPQGPNALQEGIFGHMSSSQVCRKRSPSLSHGHCWEENGRSGTFSVRNPSGFISTATERAPWRANRAPPRSAMARNYGWWQFFRDTPSTSQFKI